MYLPSQLHLKPRWTPFLLLPRSGSVELCGGPDHHHWPEPSWCSAVWKRPVKTKEYEVSLSKRKCNILDPLPYPTNIFTKLEITQWFPFSWVIYYLLPFKVGLIWIPELMQNGQLCLKRLHMLISFICMEEHRKHFLYRDHIFTFSWQTLWHYKMFCLL